GFDWVDIGERLRCGRPGYLQIIGDCPRASGERKDRSTGISRREQCDSQLPINFQIQPFSLLPHESKLSSESRHKTLNILRKCCRGPLWNRRTARRDTDLWYRW